MDRRASKDDPSGWSSTLQPMDAEQLVRVAPGLPGREAGLLRQRAEILHRVFVRDLGVDRLALRERDLVAGDTHALRDEAHQMHLDAARMRIVEGIVREGVEVEL